MCNSRRKMDVVVTRRTPFGNDKQWVRVTLKRSQSFYPSFRDIGRMVAAIAKCEQERYPQGRGAELLLEYLSDAVREAVLRDWNVDWDALDATYKIPVRCDDGEA